jgi:hypothetical protein
MRSLLQQFKSRTIEKRVQAAKDRAVDRHMYPYCLRRV